MAEPKLVPALVVLRAEFNELAAGRDRASDGWIGDRDHQERSSNHNPDDTPGSKTPQTDADDDPDVRGLDVDDTGPWPPGMTFGLAMLTIVDRHRRGVDNRADNVIYDRRIYNDENGWAGRAYSGDNPHTEHGHIDVKASREKDTRPWGLVERWGDSMTKEEFVAFMREAVKDPTVRKELAVALATTDNVVHLAGTAGTPDAGLQSLIRWPGGGWLEQVKSDVAELQTTVGQLGTSVDAVRSSQTATLEGLATIIDKLNEGDNPPADPPTSGMATPAKSTTAKAPRA